MKEEILLNQMPPKMPPGYEMNLKEYKETEYLTSILLMNSTMVFMNEILKELPVDKKAVEKLLKNSGMDRKDAESWKKIFDDQHAIDEEIKKFHEVCWPDIRDINCKSSSTAFRYTAKGCTLNSVFSAEKIYMAISEKGDLIEHVSVVGPASSGQSCGLQDIFATKENAIELLRSIISNWDPQKYLIVKEEEIKITW